MYILSDFHTHTSFCDGKNTPREMIERALALGFCSYGFSEHSVAQLDTETCALSIEGERDYVKQIQQLKEEYRGKIDIFLGIEQELLSAHPTDGYEYVIGSVHVLETPKGQFPLDLHPDNITRLTKECFDGDFESLAEAYFNAVKTIPQKINASVIGHIDLLSKFQNRISLNMGKRYFDAAFNAVDAIIPYKIPFEVNVGAITRGYRTTPYPDPNILRYVCERGGEIMINGDTHSAVALGKHLSEAAALAASCGFSRRLVISKSGYEALKL